MPKYQIETDQGTFEVETDNSTPQADKYDPTQFIKDHPFKAMMQPVSVTMGGPSAQDAILAKQPYIQFPGRDLPMVSPLVRGAEIGFNTFKDMPASAVGFAADTAQTPSSYLPIPGAQLLGKIPVGATNVGRLASKVPLNKNAIGVAQDLISNDVVPSAKNFEKLIPKVGAEYRKLINPGKGELKDIEITKGRNINDYFDLAAKEKIVINKGADNKLDTTLARQQLSEIQAGFETALDNALASNPEQRFNLKQIGKIAKLRIAKDFNNAKELKLAQEDIDNYIAEEIARHGDVVDGKTLNQIKRGMWGQGYTDLRPTADRAARKVGNTIKVMIEKSYDDDVIKTLNENIAERVTLSKILEKAHGRVINRGRIGRYADELAGTLVGGGIGASVGGPLGGAVGSIAGKITGSAVSNYLNDPERITASLVKKMRGYQGEPTPVIAEIIKKANSASKLPKK